MDKELLRKYVAIKPKGFPNYIWFDMENVIYGNGFFIGIDGWATGGAYTNIKISDEEILSFIYSDELNY